MNYIGNINLRLSGLAILFLLVTGVLILDPLTLQKTTPELPSTASESMVVTPAIPVSVSSADSVGYHHQGKKLATQKKYEQAIAAFTKAIELNSEYAAAYANRANAYLKLTPAKFSEAISDLKKAIALEPVKWPDLYTERCFAYFKQEKFTESLADCSKAISLDSKQSAAFFGRALLYTGQGEYNKAISDITKVIALQPKEALAFHVRASIYELQGKHKKAKSDFKKIRQLMKNIKS